MFIIYDSKTKPSKKVYSSGQLWGCGRTLNSAWKDAKRWAKSYNKGYGKQKVNPDDFLVARVFKADKHLYEVLNEDGGTVSFTVRKGRVISVRSPWGWTFSRGKWE